MVVVFSCSNAQGFAPTSCGQGHTETRPTLSMYGQPDRNTASAQGSTRPFVATEVRPTQQGPTYSKWPKASTLPAKGKTFTKAGLCD
jgi:hypothetical protein